MTGHPEQQYLDLLRQALEHGDKRVDRTGVGTLSVFGATLRFDLSDGQVPIMTTKRVYWKTAVREMLWFLTGGTNIRPLLENGVRIWSDWPRRASAATVCRTPARVRPTAPRNRHRRGSAPRTLLA